MRYVLHEGYELIDGQMKYVSAKELLSKYGITTEPYILAPHREARRASSWRYRAGDIKLWPSQNGLYVLPRMIDADPIRDRPEEHSCG